MNHMIGLVDSSFSMRLTLTLLHCLWQGCCCGILVMAGGTLFQNRSARFRYLWNWTSLCLLAVSLPVTFSQITISDSAGEVNAAFVDVQTSITISREPDESGPKTERPRSPHGQGFAVSDAASTSPPFAESGTSVSSIRDEHDPSTSGKSKFPSASTDQTFRRVSGWVTATYVTGVILALARVIRGTWGGQRLRHASQVVQDQELLKLIETLASRIGLRLRPPVAWCREISIPVVVGVIMPMILLPVATVSGLSSKQLEALLLHELAHIRRFDPLLNLLQRVIEAVFFFHPVVWFIGRRISMEREHAADDMVLEQGWERPHYADALLRVAELSLKTSGKPNEYPATMLGAAGTGVSEFKLRILRVLEVSPPAELFPSQTAIFLTLLVGAFGGMFIFSQPINRSGIAQHELDARPGELPPELRRGDFNPGQESPVDAVDTNVGSAERNLNEQQLANWSEPTNGLRIRVVPVSSSMSEEAIDPTQRVTTFSSPDDVAFAVEVENRSLRTISLLDTRYGESFGPAKGKPSSDWFSQFLFAIEIFDRHGDLVEHPDVQIVDLNSVLDGVLLAPLLPGEIHHYLLRPTKWTLPLGQRFEPGTYCVAIRYLGMPQRVVARIKEYRPQSAAADAWGGDVVSPRVEFEVLAPPTPTKSRGLENNVDAETVLDGPLLNWGEASNGLQAAVSLLPTKSVYAHGEIVQIRFHVQNVSDKPVTLASPLQLSSIPRSVSNQLGEGVRVQGVTRLGRTLVSRTTIRPAQTVVFDAGNLGLALTSGRSKSFKATTNRWLVAPAGEYSLQLGSFFGDLLLKDGNDKVLAPLAGDWVGELKSEQIPLKVVNETIYCEIVDAVTGELIPDATTSFLFIKPKSAGSEEETVQKTIFARKNTGRIPFFIPDTIQQRADREEFEVRWGAGNHPDYENYVPAERIPLKQFFQSDSKYIHDTLGTIKLTPKKRVAALDPKIQPAINRLPDHLNVMAIEYDRKNDELVSVSTRTDVAIRRWNVETQGLKHEVKLATDRHGNQFLFSGQLTLSDDCHRLMANIDGAVEVWDTSTGQRIRTLGLPPEMQYRHLSSIGGTPDLSIIAGGLMPGIGGFTQLDADAYAVIWDVASGEVLRTVTHAKAIEVKSIALSADKELLATGGQSPSTCIWKVSSGELMHVVSNDNSDQEYPDSKVSISIASQVLCLRFSPDGKKLAIGDLFGIKLVDVESGRMLHRLDLPYRFGRSSLVFSRDGSKIARVGTDKVVPIWSTQSGERLGEIPISSNCGAFATDGESFAVGLSDEKNATVIWPLSPDGVPTKD